MRNVAGLPKGTAKWQRAPLGAGGWLRGGIYISAAGDVMTGGDTCGVWIRPNGAKSFFDLMNTTSLPAGSFGAITQVSDTPYGMQVMGMAPSNGNYCVFAFNSSLYKTANALAASPSVTKIGGPYSAATFQSNSDGCLVWPKVTFDPLNPDYVLIGTQTTTLYYCTNFTSGTPTLNTITVDLPTSYGNGVAYHQVAVDPSSTVTGGQHMIWYYATKGVGVKRSTTGIAGPYTLVTGTPTNVRSIKVDASGNIYALNAGESSGGNLYKATSSGNFAKVATVPPYEFCDVAIDPQNTNHIVLVGDNWNLAASTDGAATWIGSDVFLPHYPGPNGINMAPQSIGWMQARDANGASGHGPQLGWQPAGGNVIFHPTNGTIYCATGQGLFKTTMPANHSSPWWWQEDTLGVEQLVIIDVVTIPGQKPIYVAADFGMLQVNDDTYAGTTSSLVAGVGDDNAYSVEYCPADSNFQVACMGMHAGSISSYRTSPTNPWTKFPGTYPRSDITFSGGVWLPETTNKIRGFFTSNVRPIKTTDRGATFTYEDVNMPGMLTKARAYLGSGNSQLIFTTVADWTGTQTYTITVSAASGSGSVTVAGSTITVVPATTGTTATAIAAQINANGAAAALVTTTAGGTGAGTVTPGTAANANNSANTTTYIGGWGWAGLNWDENQRAACIDKVTGNSYAYNGGDDQTGINASWAGIWKLVAGATTWSRVCAPPGTIGSVQTNLREILGQADHMLLHSGGSALYRTTNGWATNSQVGDGAGHFFSGVSFAHAGKAAPGQTYPAVYVLGTLNGTYAFWACFDGSWTNWVQYSDRYPLGLVYGIGCFSAHPDIFGRLDAGTSGAGGYFCTYDCPITLT